MQNLEGSEILSETVTKESKCQWILSRLDSAGDGGGQKGFSLGDEYLARVVYDLVMDLTCAWYALKAK